nr:Flp pilus assembly protein CpaB [Petropleomorpha daqingensis]
MRRALAALLAAGALALALRSPPAADAGVASTPVVVAAADLAAGTTLSAGDLRVARLPLDTAPAGRADDPSELIGRGLAGAVRAGESVTDVRLVGPGLTSGLPDDQVAAPVRLADLAVTALVRAGDRVDVLATAPDAATAEVVAADALVLAAPGPVDEATGDAGLLVLAVDASTAARLAAVATTATLTVSLPAP